MSSTSKNMFKDGAERSRTSLSWKMRRLTTYVDQHVTGLTVSFHGPSRLTNKGHSLVEVHPSGAEMTVSLSTRFHLDMTDVPFLFVMGVLMFRLCHLFCQPAWGVPTRRLG